LIEEDVDASSVVFATDRSFLIQPGLRLIPLTQGDL
jgi:hypothetical protein